MFTDIVGSTALVEAIGDEAWHDLLRWHDEALRRCFATSDGEEVHRTGDGFFVAFSDAHSALGCAVAIQRTLADHRRDHGFAPGVRVGIHSAEATRAAGTTKAPACTPPRGSRRSHRVARCWPASRPSRASATS